MDDRDRDDRDHDDRDHDDRDHDDRDRDDRNRDDRNRDDEDLAEAFADIARQLQAERSPGEVLDRITAIAVRLVEGCDHAGITIVHPGGSVATAAASDDVQPRVDALQDEAGEGPCLEAIAEHDTYLIDDLSAEDRWPRFSRAAFDRTGVRSILSFRLFLEEDTIGALNLHSRTAGAFDEHARAVGAVLAAHAAVAITTARERERADNLERALESNREIGIAIGILMARGRRTRQEAFVELRQASQHLNVKLRDVATAVADTGELPERR